MRTIPAHLLTALLDNHSNKSVYIVFSNGSNTLTVRPPTILDFKIVSNSNVGDSLKFGSCASSQIDITLKRDLIDDTFDFENSTIEAYEGFIGPMGLSDYIKMGTFICEEPTYDQYNLRITGNDFMTKLDKRWMGYVEPKTLKEFIKAICRSCGITFKEATLINQDFAIDTKVYEQFYNASYRSILSMVLEVAGAFAFMNQDNELEVKWYDKDAEPDLILSQNNSDFFDFTESLKDISFLGTSCFLGKDLGWSASDDENKVIRLTTDNPLLLYNKDAINTASTNLGNLIYGLTYRPCSFTCRDYFHLELGDKIRIIDSNDEQHYAYVMSITHDLFTSQIECFGKKKESLTYTEGVNPTEEKEEVQLDTICLSSEENGIPLTLSSETTIYLCSIVVNTTESTITHGSFSVTYNQTLTGEKSTTEVSVYIDDLKCKSFYHQDLTSGIHTLSGSFAIPPNNHENYAVRLKITSGAGAAITINAHNAQMILTIKNGVASENTKYPEFVITDVMPMINVIDNSHATFLGITDNVDVDLV